MLPVVALVGRPNVGKSTLFNRLTRSRDALVADYPGLTRDRQYGQAEVEEHPFIVIDTGGINGDEEGIDLKMAEQSLMAVEEADAILFLVDARDGLTAADHGIAEYLRKQDKKVFLVANKIDGIDGDSAVAEFYSLGLGEQVHQIAAAHGRGVTQLLTLALTPHIEGLAEPKVESEENDEFAFDEDDIDYEEISPKHQKRMTPLSWLLLVSLMWVSQRLLIAFWVKSVL